MKLVNAVFAKARIETPENIAFTYEIAGPGTRMIAYVIDFMLMLVVMGTFNFVIGSMIENTRSRNSETFLVIFLGGADFILIALGGFNLFFEFIMNGSSPGKSAMGIRIIQDNGAAASFQSLVVRNMFRFIDCCVPFQYMIGAATLVFSQTSQRFGDMAAGTLVIREKSEVFSTRYRWKMGKKNRVFNREVQLSREEFDYLMEYVDLFRNFPLAQRNRISMKLATLISKNHQLEQHPDFGPLVLALAEREEDPSVQPHRKAEDIFRLLLEYYATQAEGGAPK